MPLAFVLALASFAVPAAAGTASGALTIQGETIALQYAYAYQVEAGTENAQRATIVIVSDRALPDSIISADLEGVDLLATGMRGLFLMIDPPRVRYRASVPPERSWEVEDPTALPSQFSAHMLVPGVSADSPFGEFRDGDIQQLSDSRLVSRFKGEFYFRTETLVDAFLRTGAAPEESKAEYDVRVEVDVAPLKPEPPPGPPAAASELGSGSATAYYAFWDARRNGDAGLVSELASPKLAARLAQPGFWPSLFDIAASRDDEVLDLRILQATEEGDSAKLRVAGNLDGADASGRIWLERTAGRWLVQKTLWRRDGGIGPPPPPPPPPPPR